MIVSTSEVKNGNAETLVAASHPKGLLRGIAARRAFTAIVPLQSAARRFIARRKYPDIAAIVPVIWTRQVVPPRSSTSTVTPRKTSSAHTSGSRIPILASPPTQPSTPTKPPKVDPQPETTRESEGEALEPPAPSPVSDQAYVAPKFDGPEHTLVHLTILLGTAKKECARLGRQIQDKVSEVNQHQSRVETQEVNIAKLEASMDKNLVTTTSLEKLEAALVGASRELDVSMAREAAGKGLLLQLKSKARAQARTHSTWHQKRNAVAGLSGIEAEQMMRDTIARAKVYADAASAIATRNHGDDAPKYVNLSTFTGVRDMGSETRIRLVRRRSPLAPPPKPKAPPVTKIPRLNPSLAPSTSSMAEGSSAEADAAAATAAKRRSLPVSAVVSTQVRQDVNAKLEAFYSLQRPDSRASLDVSQGGSTSVVQPKPSKSTPPSSFALSSGLFDEMTMPSNMFKATETKLDLDLKLPSVTRTAPSSAPTSPLKSMIPKLMGTPTRPSTSTPPEKAPSPPPVSPLTPPRASISKRSRNSMPVLAASSPAAKEQTEVGEDLPPSPSPVQNTPSLLNRPSPPRRRAEFARTRAYRPVFDADDRDAPSRNISQLLGPSHIPSRSFARSSSLLGTPLTPLDPNVEAQLPSWASELLAPLQRPRLSGHKHTPSGTESVKSFGEMLKFDVKLPATSEDEPSPKDVPDQAKGKSKAQPSEEQHSPAPRPSRLDLKASNLVKIPQPPPSAVSKSSTQNASPTKSEWDVMSTTEFQARDSFQLVHGVQEPQSPAINQAILNVDPYAHLSPDKKAKMRKRSSYGLPLPSASFGGGGTAGGAEPERTGAKWKRRLSNGLSGLPVPLFRQSHAPPGSPSAPPSSFSASLSAAVASSASPPTSPIRKKRSSLLSLSSLYH